MTEPALPDPAYLQQIAAETQLRAAALATATPAQALYTGAPEALRASIERQIAAVSEDLDHIVHTLHANPETAYQEHHSARVLVEVLAKHGIDVTTGVHGIDTALRAEIMGGKPGKTIAILSEYDALPDIGHACGHNVIAATGVGAFLALAGIRDQLEGPGGLSWHPGGGGSFRQGSDGSARSV